MYVYIICIIILYIKLIIKHGSTGRTHYCVCAPVIINIVTCCLCNATNKFTEVSDLASKFTGQSPLHLQVQISSTYNVARRFLQQLYPLLAPLISVKSSVPSELPEDWLLF
jgi:hypothetical protein